MVKPRGDATVWRIGSSNPVTRGAGAPHPAETPTRRAASWMMDEGAMMAAMSAVATARIHTGPCVVFPRLKLFRGIRPPSEGAARVREFYLVDGRGHRIGVISAPEGRPTLGWQEPTVYLRRA